MLPRNYRIGLRPRIEHVLKKGRRLNCVFFQLRYLENKLARHRFSLVVSKKVGKTAVARNSIRRAAYAALRNSLKKHDLHRHAKTCYDVVALLSYKIVKAPYIDIENEFAKSIKRL